MKKLLLIAVVIAMLLSACQIIAQSPHPTATPLVSASNNNTASQHENEASTNTFSPAAPLLDENYMTEVHYFEHDISYSINRHWLLDALKHSQTVDTPQEIMALEFELTFTFASGKEVTLRYLDENNHIFSIRQDGQSYALQSEEICTWLDYVNDVMIDGYSARGKVTEIDTEHKVFVLESVEQGKHYNIALSDKCTTSFNDITIGDPFIVLFNKEIPPESDDEEYLNTTVYKADYIIVDNYQQISDNTSN